MLNVEVNTDELMDEKEIIIHPVLSKIRWKEENVDKYEALIEIAKEQTYKRIRKQK